jgi:hypothetical protein
MSRCNTTGMKLYQIPFDVPLAWSSRTEFYMEGSSRNTVTSYLLEDSMILDRIRVHYPVSAR